MNKIRKIIEKYRKDLGGYGGECVFEHDFDRLEKELQKLMTKAVNRAFKNAEKKLYAKASREGIHTE